MFFVEFCDCHNSRHNKLVRIGPGFFSLNFYSFHGIHYESYSRAGQSVYLALERALLHHPRLVLFDEPFTGLDDRASGLVADRLRALAAGGAIVVLATHDLDLADGLVTRVALVRNGKLVSDEPASSGLRARYRALIGAA